MNPLYALVLSFFLFACNAYRTQPESEILYTKQDLTKKGFVLAPIAKIDPKDESSVSDLDAFDTILANTLKETWPNARLLPSGEIATILDSDATEAWRADLTKEDQAEPSVSTLAVLKKLTQLGRAYPPQVLLPSLIQNTVSCGQKEAQPTYLNPKPKSGKAYCQRILKMRFRIMSTAKSELLWNGIIYATQESTTSLGSDANGPVDPPSTQALVRDCFNNFARQFAEK